MSNKTVQRLITKGRYVSFPVNMLTQEMDRYIIRNNELFHTYVFPEKIGSRYSLRYPGATVGYIEVDDDIIVGVKLYSDINETLEIYDNIPETCFNKYIGMKLVIR